MSGGIPVSQDYKSDLLLIKKNHFPWFRWLVRFTLYSKKEKNVDISLGLDYKSDLLPRLQTIRGWKSYL